MELEKLAEGNAAVVQLTKAVEELEGKVADVSQTSATMDKAASKALDAQAAAFQTKVDILSEKAQSDGEHINRLEGQLADLQGNQTALLNQLATMSAALSVAATAKSASADATATEQGCTGGCSPTVEADGEVLTMRATNVQFETGACGATDLCELRRTVDALEAQLAGEP